MSTAEFQFCKLPIAITRRSDIDPLAKILFAVLMDEARGAETVSVGTRRLAELVGECRPAVLRALGQLAAVGIIDRPAVRNGRRHVITLNMKAVNTLDRSKVLTGQGSLPVKIIDRKRSTPLTGSGQQPLPRPDSDSDLRTSLTGSASAPTPCGGVKAGGGANGEGAIVFDAHGRTFHRITDEDRAAWGLAYPACNIDRQLRAMAEWCLGNPTKAVKKNWRRFITNWLAREQERGGDERGMRNGKQNGSAARVRGGTDYDRTAAERNGR